MILIAAAALAASPPSTPVRAMVEARATVRILSGTRLQLGKQSDDGRPARTGVVRIDGAPKSAQLIEFE
jgi:hypothetical protein